MGRRGSSFTMSVFNVEYPKNTGTESTTNLAQLECQFTVAPKTVFVISRIQLHNLHRIILSVFVLAVGIATMFVVFSSGKGTELRDYFSRILVIMSFLPGLGLFMSWFRIWSIGRVLHQDILNYRKLSEQDPNVTFKGNTLPKWRLCVMVTTSYMGTILGTVFLVDQSILLYKAWNRFHNGMDDPRLDATLLALFCLNTIGAAANFFSTAYAASMALVLIDSLPLNIVRKWCYPLLFFLHPGDTQPVLLL